MGNFLEGKARVVYAVQPKFSKRDIRDEARDRILEMVAAVVEGVNTEFWVKDNRHNPEMSVMSDNDYKARVAAALETELKAMAKRYGYGDI